MGLRHLAVTAVLIAACGHGFRGPRWPDAAVDLRDEGDRDSEIDRFWTLAPGPERTAARDRIAAAIARRLGDAIDARRTHEAAQLLDEITVLWQADPAAVGAGLARHGALLDRARAAFSRAGALEPAVQTLVLLGELEPARQKQRATEIDEILAFADELAIAEHGPDGVRAQPIQLLQATAHALPLPRLVDRYIDLVLQRRAAIATVLERESAPYGIVRAHRDIVHASRRIANVLARAGRTAEIHGKISSIKTIGFDRDLALRVELVADQPTPMAYVTLAGSLRAHEKAPDPAAALAVCMAGLQRFPGDSELLGAAAESARLLGRVEQPIALFEQSLRADPEEVEATSALRLGKLYAERIGRIATAGRPRAAIAAFSDVQRFTARMGKSHPSYVWHQVDAIAESALGKGLASQGLVDDGRRVLASSLSHAPSIDAFESLSRLETQVGAFAAARRWAQRGLDLLGTSAGDRYRRAKLERIAGDAMRRAGRKREADEHYRDSVRAWASLGDDKELAPTIVAERYLDEGRARWWIGDAAAVDLVLKAGDNPLVGPRATVSDEIPAGVVAFLIQAGRYQDALDAYHRGLGEPGGGELYKVYTSLWILVEGRRLGQPRDRLASDYLASRSGDLWYERLARAASGKLTYDELREFASTGPQKGELAFYGAMLGLDPKSATTEGRRALLEQTIAARVVFDTEYDLARLYLTAL